MVYCYCPLPAIPLDISLIQQNDVIEPRTSHIGTVWFSHHFLMPVKPFTHIFYEYSLQVGMCLTCFVSFKNERSTVVSIFARITPKILFFFIVFNYVLFVVHYFVLITMVMMPFGKKRYEIKLWFSPYCLPCFHWCRRSKHDLRIPTVLFLSTNGNNNEIEEIKHPDYQIYNGPKQKEKSSKLNNDVPSPPSFLSFGYNVAAFLNVIAAVALIFNTPTAVSAASVSTSAGATDTAALLNRYQPTIFGTYVAGCLGHLLLAGGTCQILAESVRTNRLFTSDTYKRLTMGTMLFGTLGLLSIPGEAGCNAFMSAGVFTVTFLAKLVTAIVSFSGWEYAADGFGDAFRRMKNISIEIFSGCRSVWNTLPVTEERPATFYRTFFIFIILGNIAFNFPQMFYNLKQGAGLFSLPISLTISSIARLCLLSTVVYVLKDASERKRLEGTTFIKLNTIVGLWAIGGKS